MQAQDDGRPGTGDGLDWHAGPRLEELPDDGTGLSRTFGRRHVALFRQGGRVLALDDTCPHAGASLGAGVARDGEVTCPAHGMHFDLATGRCTDGLPERVRPWAVRVDGDGRVWVARRPAGGFV